MSGPRVRFAPAPTGFLHVGSARSALFNWLFARHTGGTFVLRVEDTDEAKTSQEFVDAITEPLSWLGLDWDEGPLFQSERRERHVDAVDRLVAEGKAYFCDLTRDEIEARCEEAGLPAGYHGFSRDRDVVDGPGVVVRFRAPDEGSTVVDDVIRGRVEVAHETIEDFVIRRGDGSPVFLIANAVDDHEMGITHVIRGEDLLNTTPKVLLLWDALGFGEPPTYAHLPLLVNEQRKKLSKRRDDVALADYVARGYLPEAMRNALALLGWGPDDEVEIRPIEEIIERFTLESVNKAPAFFDPKKLDHINAEYIKAMTPMAFIEAAEPWLTADDAPYPVANYDRIVALALAEDVQQRVVTLAEAPAWLDWLFVDAIEEYDEKSWAKAIVKGTVPGRVLDDIAAALADDDFTDRDRLESVVMGVGTALSEELDTRVMSQAPLRIALTGRGAGIPLWEAMTHLGRDVCLERIAAAGARID
ncbi:MAG: glutamate--tRNA ligase [Acidimicrobiales bacterium]|nr:MAG: glutamate--tRNA ligase [Acidimicrobiales bacterium]